MAQAILAHSGTQVLQLAVSKRLDRAILARPVGILEGQNGSSHSGTASCKNGSSRPFGNGQFGVMLYLISTRMAQAILALINFRSIATDRARMARAILTLQYSTWPCQNGSSYSGTQLRLLKLAVPEWLEQIGSSHSGTARYYIGVPKWLKPSWHGQARPVAILEGQNGVNKFIT